MDELTLDDKKYISTKRAAKLTGYAKDYVGQLCREGRVEARLVGRSWYVLESALEDHRFGAHDKAAAVAAKAPDPVLPASTWEAPRYESVSGDLIPQVEKSTSPTVDEPQSAPREAVPLEALHDAWQEWFSSRNSTPSMSDDATREAEIPHEEMPEQVHLENHASESETEAEIVPIRAIHHAALREVPEREEPRPVEISEEGREETVRMAAQDRPKRKRRSRARTYLLVGGSLAAVAVALIAVVNTGYLDGYITSSQTASVLTGVYIYNK